MITKEYAKRVLELLDIPGEIEILGVYENGFEYTRKTEYMKCRGIAEYTGTNKDPKDSMVGVYTWCWSEIVIERYK